MVNFQAILSIGSCINQQNVAKNAVSDDFPYKIVGGVGQKEMPLSEKIDRKP